MTNLKVCSKIHLFIIISVLFIAIGMAVGTACHFAAGGFFNYGGEFGSYNSVTVTYYSSEYKDVEDVKPVCAEHLKDFNAYSVSYSETELGGEIIYKYSSNTDVTRLVEAAERLSAALDTKNSGLNSVSVREASVEAGGSAAVTYASIAVSAAVCFMFAYFILRYKLRAALTSLVSCVHNLGIFVALAAVTRLPLGIETVAIGVAVVLLTMIINCIFFDKVRKNFADEKYEKADRVSVVEQSAADVRMLVLIILAALAVAALITGMFATIASAFIGTYAPYILAVLGVGACCYGSLFFTPAIHGAMDGRLEALKKSPKTK